MHRNNSLTDNKKPPSYRLKESIIKLEVYSFLNFNTNHQTLITPHIKNSFIIKN